MRVQEPGPIRKEAPKKKTGSLFHHCTALGVPLPICIGHIASSEAQMAEDVDWGS